MTEHATTGTPKSASTTIPHRTTPAALAEPRRLVPARWIAAFATAWLGIWMAQLTSQLLLLPIQVEARVDSDVWVEKVVAFGIISGISGVCALIAYPLTGALSDRTTSRFGRRRPWILGGAILFAVSLSMLGLQTTMVGIGILWSSAIVGYCVLTSALTATISDQVPVNQRGFVSGWLSAPQAVGVILGLVLVLTLGLSLVLSYTMIGILLVLLVLPFVLRIPDAVLPKEHRRPFTLRGLVTGFWIDPRRFPDFGWTMLSRVLVNSANAFGTALLLYFLQDGLHLENPRRALVMLAFIYMVFVITASLVLGRVSDRTGRRKVFVMSAAGLLTLAALLLAFVPQYEVAMVAAGLLGLGYGTFLSVDQALATQVLPYAAARGKDLGIMNIASTVPQAIAPLFGALLVAALLGFQGLFLLAAIAALMGGLAVIPIRSVR